jgi:hypothetical protein
MYDFCSTILLILFGNHNMTSASTKRQIHAVTKGRFVAKEFMYTGGYKMETRITI